MKRITLRLPDELGDAMEELANKKSHSLNAEIIAAINEHLIIEYARDVKQRIDSGEEKVVSHDELMRKMKDRHAEADKAFAEMKAGKYYVWVHAREWEYLQEALKFAQDAGFGRIDESELEELQ